MWNTCTGTCTYIHQYMFLRAWMIFSHVYSVLVFGIERILSIVYNVFLHDILLWCIFRLTPSLMLLMFVYVPLFPYLSDGPFWPQKGLEQGQCNKTWWYNMLYINNFFNEVSINVDILKVGLRLKFSQFFLFYRQLFYLLTCTYYFLGVRIYIQSGKS